MRNTHRYLALVALFSSTLACRDEMVSVTCSNEGTEAISLMLQDAVTGATSPFTAIVAVASDGAYRDTVRMAAITGEPNTLQSVSLAGSRAGRYTVEVSAQGYARWTTSVTVEKEPVCNRTITRVVTVPLQRLQ